MNKQTRPSPTRAELLVPNILAIVFSLLVYGLFAFIAGFAADAGPNDISFLITLSGAVFVIAAFICVALSQLRRSRLWALLGVLSPLIVLALFALLGAALQLIPS